jgi:hypothetical protein
LDSAYRRDDKFASKEANSRDGTISNERDGSKRVDNGVSVSEPLEPLEVAGVTVPERAMPAEENLDRAEGPPEHLVQPIRKIYRGGSFECGSVRHTVDGFPASAMHLETRQDIFRH